MGRSDEELVAAIRAGDETAFEVLYERYSRRLFGYLLRLVKDRDLAEDLLQEVFLTVLTSTAYQPQAGRLGGFLFKAARHRGLTALRNAKRRGDKLSEEAEVTPQRSESHEAQTADRRTLSSVLTQLTEQDRDALILKAVGGLTYREIAEVQEVPEGTVKSRLHGAIRLVRRRFDKEFP